MFVLLCFFFIILIFFPFDLSFFFFFAEPASGSEVHGRSPRAQHHHRGQEVCDAGLLPAGRPVSRGLEAEGPLVHHRTRSVVLQVVPPASGKECRCVCSCVGGDVGVDIDVAGDGVGVDVVACDIVVVLVVVAAFGVVVVVGVCPPPPK